MAAGMEEGSAVETELAVVGKARRGVGRNLNVAQGATTCATVLRHASELIGVYTTARNAVHWGGSRRTIA